MSIDLYEIIACRLCCCPSMISRLYHLLPPSVIVRRRERKRPVVGPTSRPALKQPLHGRLEPDVNPEPEA